MNNWIEKNKVILAIGALAVFALIYISTVSSSLPNPNFVPDDRFTCSTWESAALKSQSAESFVISLNGKDYYYSSFEPEDRIFSHNTIGYLENMRHYGKIQAELSAGNRPRVALVSTEGIIYSCNPTPIS